MAMRRPRIKAAAFLNSKRKTRETKSGTQEKLSDEGVNDEHLEKSQEPESESPTFSKTDDVNDESDHDLEVGGEEIIEEVFAESESPTATEEMPIEKTLPIVSAVVNSFKCPQSVQKIRNVEDGSQMEIEEDVIHMDLQKSTNGFPMSPTKTQSRPRIRPTPVMQRRNSFIGSTAATFSPASEDVVAVSDPAVPPQRRERHHSASIAPNTSSATMPHHYTSHKFAPNAGLGRIRTESGCSVFSDSYAVKSRKNDDHNHRPYSRRDYEARFNNGIPDKSCLKMFDLIYYNPSTNPMEQKSYIKKEVSSPDNPEINEEMKPLPTNELKDNEVKSAIPVPQLKLDANGDLILDDKSLEIETTAEQEARKTLANSSLIYMDENNSMNGFYRRQPRTKDWSREETIRFYQCLQTIGTDFSLMSQLFQKRSRRDLKLKFKKEERSNLALINKALLYPKTFNIDELKNQLDSAVQQSQEAERKWREIKALDAKPIKKVHVKTSIAARSLKNGDDIYKNENVIKRKLSNRPPKDTQEVDEKNIQSTGIISNQKPQETAVETKPVKKIKRTDSKLPFLKPKRSKTTKHNCENRTVEGVDALQNVSIKTEISTEKPATDDYEYESADNFILNNLIDDKSSYSNPNYQSASNSPYRVLYTEPETEPESENNTTESGKTMIDMDCGTVNTINDFDAVESNDSIIKTLPQKRELNESDIQMILTELAEGSLVLVSTLDPNNADKVLNEIYILDKESGELSDTPLDIPEAIVQSILSVMS